MPRFISYSHMTVAEIPDRSSITGERVILTVASESSTLVHGLGQDIMVTGNHGRRGGPLHDRQEG